MGNDHPVHWTRLGAWGLTGALAVGGLVGIARPAAGAFSCPQVGATVTCTFNDDTDDEAFPVPAGITSATITLQGGSGGAGYMPNGDPFTAASVADTAAAGGAGGRTSAQVDLTGITSLRIWVGGVGDDGVDCDAGDGANGGRSGGIITGGQGGSGTTDGDGCDGGAGGGASFVMVGNESPEDIDLENNDGAVPLLVAGGGGGGTGGDIDGGHTGGQGGGNVSGAAESGAGPFPGVGGAIPNRDFIVGAPGGSSSGPAPHFNAGGGGGGGYPGGGAGAEGASDDDPSGGGGGGGKPAGAPAGEATAGGSGSVTIQYTISSQNTNPKDTTNCDASDDTCVAQPPPGEESAFKVTALNGNTDAVLIAILNGGPPPKCVSFGGNLSPDWVQFGFTKPKAGKSWAKRIQVTGTDPMSFAEAVKAFNETQICFAAPYRFVVKKGTQLKKTDNGTWEGILAACGSERIKLAKEAHPNLARPCVIGKDLLSKSAGYVLRITYKVPKGELDPQGRSVRKKKRRH